ncbi:MAG: dockerin type I domain-containing protein [Clostridiales bacterium]|nr:dockerin type I domain-containing protein [Clostridiales bacterium]
MKKRLFAALTAFVMASAACINFTVPGFARATISSNAGYNYRNTKGLEADYADGSLILTWPSVAKDGTLLNQNPLTAYAQSDEAVDSADPMASWTMPYRGLIVNYNGYSPAYSASKVSISLTGEEEVYMGFVEGEEDGCQTILDYAYDSSAAAYLTGKTSHVDTTVVTTGYATSYRIDYSEDGTNWTAADTTSTFNTQKKVDMPVQDGVTAKTDKNGNEYIQDNKNTVFLVTQQVESFPSDIELEEGETYYVRVVPLDSSGNEIEITDAEAESFSISFTAENSNTIKVPAFPTVVGGGTYTSGGRTTLSTEGQVYVVTSLDDSVSNPQEGTLRYGLNKARSSTDTPLTIVFAVGGTIHVDPAATKSQRRFVFGSNLTVAGQTAPGEGITIAGGTCNISGENIMLRYLRFRLGEGYDLDGATASGKNIVVDHCTFSWGVDETFSAKELINSTLSYNIITGGLAMVNKNGENTTDAELLSGESEAKHGMGSIMNGYNTTIVHNIWAGNGTRNPRFEGGFTYGNKDYDNLLEFANNVVYNWGHMSSYGGDRGKTEEGPKTNFESNYYKSGPNTLEKVKAYFFDCDTDSSYGGYHSTYYIDGGNIMEGNETLNNNNAAGFIDLGTEAYRLDEKAELKIPYEPTDAKTAYADVLAGAGASFVRDAQDDRLLSQIENGTGRFINNEAEAGGYITIEDALHNGSTGAAYDSDSDGIPDAYETALGTDPDKADSTTLITDETSPFYGYTYLEVYLNDILGEWGENSVSSVDSFTSYASDRTLSSDDIEITGILDAEGNNILSDGNTDLILGETYYLELGGNSAMTDVYNYNVLFDDETVSTSLEITPEEIGSYLLQVAVAPDIVGSYAPYTISDQVGITVLESEENIPDFTAADIGSVRESGNVSYDSQDGSIIIEGAGLVGRTSAASNSADDAFYFDYTEMTGDFDISAQVEMWAKLDYYQKVGIMARASVDEGKPEFYWNAVTYIKGEDYESYTGADGGAILARNIGPFVRTSANGSVSSISSSTIGTFMSVAKKRMNEEQTPMYMRMTRVGDTITLYGGTDGENWTQLSSYETTLPETCYVGFAIDAAQDNMDFIRYNKALITNVVINGVALGESGGGSSGGGNDDDDENNGVVGDVDQSGKITANDAAVLLQYIIGSTANEEWAVVNEVADVNNDEVVDAADAAKILAKVLNAAVSFERTNQ